MADFQARRDMTGITAFTDAGSEFVFDFEATGQTVSNESASVMELSWDGTNVHGRLDPGTPSAVISYPNHSRKSVFVRIVGGGSGDSVQVIAQTR
jgi:hypothetical protein